jgi:two-component system nitrogen regulation response regulator NtrX
VLPLVQSAAALNDPVPLPEAIRSLFGFLLRTTRARDGVLLVRDYESDRQPAEVCRVYDAAGLPLAVDLVPFARSVAGTAVSLQEPCAMAGLDQAAAAGNLELQPFERGRHSLLAAPLAVAPGIHVVLELFDKEAADGFTEDDRRLVGAAADFGAEMLRQALAERKMHEVLLDAVAAALNAGDVVAGSLAGSPSSRAEEPPPPSVLDQLRQGLEATPGTALTADDTLRLAEAVRVLALRHGPPAVRHCIRLVEDLRELLDSLTGAGEAERS